LHSLKKGRATAGNAAGVARGAIFEISNASKRTSAESYISSLADLLRYDRFFFGRLIIF